MLLGFNEMLSSKYGNENDIKGLHKVLLPSLAAFSYLPRCSNHITVDKYNKY